MSQPLIQTTGRRKAAVARVRLRPVDGASSITVNGRAVEDYSCFPDTQEIVASARARFVVASGPRVEAGFTYVDLVEESREYF